MPNGSRESERVPLGLVVSGQLKPGQRGGLGGNSCSAPGCSE